MKKMTALRQWIYAIMVAGLLLIPMFSHAVVLDENCVVSILNRTIQVSATGGWSMPNVPSNMGQIRARATCIVGGQTMSGQSDYFTVVLNGIADVGDIVFDVLEPIPSSLDYDPSGIGFLTAIDETLQLAVVATYPDGS